MLRKILAFFVVLIAFIGFMPKTFCSDPPSVRIEVRDSTRYYMRLKNLKQREPENAEIVYELANYHYSIKNINEAIREYKRVLQLKPEHENAKYFLSKCYVIKGYYDDAFWLVRDLILKHKKEADLYEYAGEILLKMDEHAVAQEYFSKCDELLLDKKGNEMLPAQTKPNRDNWKKYYYN